MGMDAAWMRIVSRGEKKEEKVCESISGIPGALPEMVSRTFLNAQFGPNGTPYFWYGGISAEPIGSKSVLANERTQIRSDPVPGLSVNTLGGYRVGNAVTRSKSNAARAGWDGGKTRLG